MLKTEAIEKIEAMGFSVRENKSSGKLVVRRIEGESDMVGMVATVSTKNHQVMNTDYISYGALDADDRETLFSILIEFAVTPIEDRAVAEKYVYALDMSQGESRDDMQKLAKIKPGITTWVKETVVQACNIPAYHFTDKEIEAMSEQAKLIISACIKINVADIESKVN